MTGASARRRGSSALIAIAIAIALACDDEVEAGTLRTVDPAELCAETTADGWQSAPWSTDDGSCPWIDLGGKVAIEVPHDLGSRPRAVLVYVSFTPTGTTATLASGDVARIVDVGEERIVVENATNQRFFARIVLF